MMEQEDGTPEESDARIAAWAANAEAAQAAHVGPGMAPIPPPVDTGRPKRPLKSQAPTAPTTYEDGLEPWQRVAECPACGSPIWFRAWPLRSRAEMDAAPPATWRTCPPTCIHTPKREVRP